MVSAVSFAWLTFWLRVPSVVTKLTILIYSIIYSAVFMKLYQYPNCSTCRKAITYLKDNNIEAQLINIVEQPPTKAELKAMLASYGGDIRKLFNTSGLQYRELNMKDKLPTMTANEAIALLAHNGKLIKRPFLISADKRGIVGFKETAWGEFL